MVGSELWTIAVYVKANGQGAVGAAECWVRPEPAGVGVGCDACLLPRRGECERRLGGRVNVCVSCVCRPAAARPRLILTVYMSISTVPQQERSQQVARYYESKNNNF
jgi:hypothetical protein